MSTQGDNHKLTVDSMYDEVERVVEAMPFNDYPNSRRHITITWDNGAELRGYMSPATAHRFASKAMGSHHVSSVSLGGILTGVDDAKQEF